MTSRRVGRGACASTARPSRRPASRCLDRHRCRHGVTLDAHLLRLPFTVAPAPPRVSRSHSYSAALRLRNDQFCVEWDVKPYTYSVQFALSSFSLGRIPVTDCSPPWQRSATARRVEGGATENAGFNAKVQRNIGLDFVTKQHESSQKLQAVYSLV